MFVDTLFGRSKRSFGNPENPNITLSTGTLWGEVGQSTSQVAVNETTALGVPAVWQAVNLIAGTIAYLPLHLYKVDADGNSTKAIGDPLYKILHDRANSVHTKFVFWKWIVSRLVINGRGFAIILRNRAGRVMGFLPLPENSVSIDEKIKNGNLVRTYTVGTKVYEHWDVLDLALLLKSDGKSHYSPIVQNKDSIGLMIAAENYASNLFASGGIPPLKLKMPAASSPAASARASESFNDAIQFANDRKRNVIPVLDGFDLSDLGFDPAKQQMIEGRRFAISEVSRIFNVAPAMLHDLTTGTYNNVEQQGLNFAQQTIMPIVKLIEQELNLKLFGDRNTANYVEFNMDGLIRGDLKSRIEALARGVNSGLMTPNEGRALDNRAGLEGGDVLYIQGATIPLTSAGKTPVPTPSPVTDEPNPDTLNEEDKKTGENDEDGNA